jgi:hypothetical protein
MKSGESGRNDGDVDPVRRELRGNALRENQIVGFGSGVVGDQGYAVKGDNRRHEQDSSAAVLESWPFATVAIDASAAPRRDPPEYTI